MIHELKILPEYFEAIKAEKKTFEIRKNDRMFAVGDYLALNEYDPTVVDKKNSGYTGRDIIVKVNYIVSDKAYCKAGFVILGIKLCTIVETPNFWMLNNSINIGSSASR